MEADLMDFTVLYGCLATAAIGAVVMMIMKYSYASQEDQYGEHISTLYGSGSAAKTKAARAAEKKKKAKLAKANQVKSTSNKPREDHYGQHHVAIDPEPVILGEKDGGVQAAPPTKTKPRQRKTSKSILHNKDEVPLVGSEEVESRLEFTKTSIPIDEAELLHRKQKQSKDSTLPGEGVEHSLPTVEIVEDVVLPVKSTNVQSGISQSTNQNQPADKSVTDSPRKTGKKSKSKAEEAAGNVDEVLASLDQSSLSKAELRQLVDSLLNKHGSDSWEKKSASADKSAHLSKQVASLQLALEGEKTNTAWANEQLLEMKNSLSLAERNQQAANSKLQEMQMRLQQNLDQHRAEVQGIQQARFQEIQRMQQHIQQVREENQTLHQALPKTDEVVQMRNQLRVLETELQDQQRHVMTSENKCKDLTTRLGSATEAHRLENMRCVELAGRVDELTYKSSRLDKQLTDTQTRAHGAENDLRNLQDHLRTKDTEIKELHNEILSAKQATTDTISSTSQADNSKIQQLEGTVTSLQASLDGKDTELSHLQTQLTETKTELDREKKTKPQANGAAGNDSEAEQEKVSHLEDQLMKMESELELLKDKNNDLRKKNWTMSESLNKAEEAAASVTLLESEVDKKSSEVHDLKAFNQTLKENNNELHERVDQLSSSNAHSDDLRQELKLLKQQLDEKRDIIHGLEVSVLEEKDKVTATELECKNLLENELRHSLAAIENQHKSKIDDLQTLLGKSETRITDLESLLHQSESKIKQIGHTMCNGGLEVDASRHKLADENVVLRAKIAQLEAVHSDSDKSEELTVYYQAEIHRLQPGFDNVPPPHLRETSDGNNNASKSSVEVKLVPCYGDYDVNRAELRKELQSTQRMLGQSKSELESMQRRYHSDLLRTVPEDKVTSTMKKLLPKLDLEPSSSIEQSLETFYKQTVSQAVQDSAENQYREALTQTEKMLDQLSETWQTNLDEKESEISKLQERVEELEALAVNAKTSESSKDAISTSSSGSERNLSGVKPAQVIQLANSGSLHDVSSTV